MRSPIIGLAVLMVTTQVLGQEAPAGAALGAEDAVVELADSAYRFEDDGSGSLAQTLRVRILTPGGQAAFSQIYLAMITPVERGDFEFVRTHKPDGRVLIAGAAAAVDVRQEPGDAALTGVAYKAVAPTDLAAGDTLEWRTVKRWDAVAEGDFWQQHASLAGPRVEKETVSVDVPAGRALTLRHDPAHAPEIEEAKGRRVYRWTLVERPASAKLDSLPLFALTTFHDWGAAGRWFAELQPDGKGAATVRAKARELTADVTGAREKAVAIHRWLSRSIRYVGAPFAASGYRPRPPAEVLRSGWGDCKDTHGLLAALLREAGLAAAPVLVASDGTLPYPAVPSPSQFDHVVTLVRVDGDALWLDGTLGVARPGELPHALRGSRGLAIEGGGAALVSIPEDPTPAAVTVTVTGAISEAGALDAGTTISLEGGAGLTMRLLARQAGAAGVKALLEHLGTAQSGGAAVTESTSSDPLDLDGPFVLRYHLRHDAYLGTDGRLSTPIPSVLPTLIAPQAGAAEEPETSGAAGAASGTGETGGEAAVRATRRTPPAEFRETITLAFPAGARIAVPMPVKAETAAGNYEAAYAVEGTTLTVRRTYRLPAFASDGELAARTVSLRALVAKDIGQQVAVSGWAPAAVDVAARSAEELRRLGAAALAAGHAAEAADLLGAAVAKKPSDAEALRMLANAASDSSRWSEAETAMRRLVELDPLDAQAGALLGTLLVKRGRYPEAIAALRAVVAANPYESAPWLMLGLVCRQVQQPEAALEALRSAARVDQTNPGLRLALAGILQEQGHREEARRIHGEVAAIPAVRQYSRMLPALDSDLIGPLAAMLGINPGLTPALPTGAGAEGAAERLESGLARLAAQTAVDREFAAVADLLTVAEALIVLGHADLTAGRLEPARERLEAALELTLDLAPALDLVELHARQGRFDDALRLWSVARRAPDAAMPASLAAHLEKTSQAGAKLDDTLSSLRYQVLDRRKLSFERTEASGGCGESEAKQWVVVRAIVGGDGAVTAAEPLSGPQSCRDRALAVLKAAKLPRLVVGGRGVTAPRTIAFLFHPGGTIEAQYGYGTDPFEDIDDFGSRTYRLTK